MSMTKKKTDMGWEGYGPWSYTSFREPHLTRELERLTRPTVFNDTDYVSFQPCNHPDFASQDRLVVADWSLPDGTWKFRAVFDGHAGHDTVNYVVSVLPDLIQSRLRVLVKSAVVISEDAVSTLLKQAIISLDESLTQQLLEVLPPLERLSSITNKEISALILERNNSQVVARCMMGTTVLLSLQDPQRIKLWVASLGDCQAVLGMRKKNRPWDVLVLSGNHNGADPAEAERIRREHPGEDECVLDDRVLGAIAVTRAIGDHLFKLPRVYTDKVLLNSGVDFRASTELEEFLPRNKTPPYISNIPDIRCVSLSPGDHEEMYLILCSDGLTDLYYDELSGGAEQLPSLGVRWMRCIGNAKPTDKLSLLILRDGLGGTDTERVSRMFSVEMMERWMDDTTVLVQRL